MIIATGLAGTAAFADTPDLVAHHGFEACWAAALTVDGFAAQLNAALEGYPTCIAATAGSTPICNASTCNNAPGCPLTLRSGCVAPAYFDLPNGNARFDASGGIDPLVIDLVYFGANCVVTILDTSTVVSQSQLQVPIVPNGNFGWYAIGPLAASNTSVSGLRSTDCSIGGGLACLSGGVPASIFLDAIAAAIGAAMPQAGNVMVDETICPYSQ